MKNLNRIKAVLIAGSLVFFSLTGISKVALAQSKGTATPVKYQKEKSDVNSDLLALKFQKAYIKSIEKKYNEDKAAGLKETAVMDKRQLVKANGELEMDRAYLKADKMDFIGDYNIAIDAKSHLVDKDRSSIRKARLNLDNNIASGNEEGITRESLVLARSTKALEADKLALRKEKLDRNADVLAINKKIGRTKDEPLVALKAENTMAHASDWIEK